MTEKEFRDWIDSAEYIGETRIDYDSDNKYWTRFYRKDGKVYAVAYCNGYPDYKRHTNELGFTEVIERQRILPAYTVPEKKETYFVYADDEKKEYDKLDD